MANVRRFHVPGMDYLADAWNRRERQRPACSGCPFGGSEGRRLGGSRIFGISERHADAVGRRLRGSTRLAAGDGACPADRPGAAADRRPDRKLAEALQVALARPEGQGQELSRWGDWLVMAATLTQLRSRLLLPADTSEGSGAVSQAKTLRRQLVSRDQMRAAGDWLEHRPKLGREVQTRGRAGMARTGRSVDVTELLRACLVVLRVPQELASAYQPQTPVFWRVADATARIQEILAVHPDGAALEDLVRGFAADATRSSPAHTDSRSQHPGRQPRARTWRSPDARTGACAWHSAGHGRVSGLIGATEKLLCHGIALAVRPRAAYSKFHVQRQ